MDTASHVMQHAVRSWKGDDLMRKLAYLVMAVLALAAVPIEMVDATGELPSGYRDWKLVTVAHEAGNNNDLRAVLGNDVAIKAFREKKLPYPDGTIIVRLAWRYVPSPENDKIFGRAQSFVAGSPINVQFERKDSRKYASTGGWSFVQLKDGKLADAAVQRTCFPCHQLAGTKDFVFTHYSPSP
jgi:hypothetical protein